MKPGRIVAIVVGSLLAIPSLAVVVGGTAVTVASAIEAGDDGYFDETLDRLSTATAAITTEDLDFRTDPGPRWAMDVLDVSVRLQVTAVDEGAELFVGIGPDAAVETFLSGISRDEIRDVRWDGDVRYRAIPGERSAAQPPGGEDFWVASTSGTGPLVLEWDVSEGEWIAVLMNADGSPGMLADVTVGVRSGALLGIGIAMIVVGVVFLAAAVAIILAGARRREAEAEAAPEVPSALEPRPSAAHPVLLEAAVDSPLSPWMWLVKWLLAIPHFIVLALLWVAFALLTVIAGIAILFTGRYPRGIFDFNVGVMRWSWRVLFYAASGGLGTDRYPPFSLGAEPDYPATLDVAYPAELSRGLVLVKWWLLAIPHYLVLALMVGGGVGWWWSDDWGAGVGTWGGGLVGLLVFIAAVTLLFTGRYPQPLFDLIVGLNRWAFRVFAYAALLTDRYPPFRLDQGGREPSLEEEAPPGTP
jgi:hypothetical protein